MFMHRHPGCAPAGRDPGLCCHTPAGCFVYAFSSNSCESWTTDSCVSLLTVILSLNVSWIWNPLIAGDHELAYLWGGEPSVATAWETVTLLSYPFYTLLGLFVLSLAMCRDLQGVE